MKENVQKKTLFTLAVNNYAPEICDITFPLMKAWAKKIGADFYIIKERKHPDWPVAMEKLQIFDLGQEMKNDWNIFFDADTLIKPEMFDPTLLVSKKTVMHNGNDFAPTRWKYDRYFLRDGRHISSCNWCAIASDWCIDLWHWPDDLTPEEVEKNITPVVNEHNCGIVDPLHLADDYILSRNIARYGLDFTTIIKLQQDHLGMLAGYLWHQYTVPNEKKVRDMMDILKGWRMI